MFRFRFEIHLRLKSYESTILFNVYVFRRIAARASRRYGHILWQTANCDRQTEQQPVVFNTSQYKSICDTRTRTRYGRMVQEAYGYSYSATMLAVPACLRMRTRTRMLHRIADSPITALRKKLCSCMRSLWMGTIEHTVSGAVVLGEEYHRDFGRDRDARDDTSVWAGCRRRPAGPAARGGVEGSYVGRPSPGLRQHLRAALLRVGCHSRTKPLGHHGREDYECGRTELRIAPTEACPPYAIVLEA